MKVVLFGEFFCFKKCIILEEFNSDIKFKYDVLDNIRIFGMFFREGSVFLWLLLCMFDVRLMVFEGVMLLYLDEVVFDWNGCEIDVVDCVSFSVFKSYGVFLFYLDSIKIKVNFNYYKYEDFDESFEDDDEDYEDGNEIYRVVKVVDLGILFGYQYRKFWKLMINFEMLIIYFVKIKVK